MKSLVLSLLLAVAPHAAPACGPIEWPPQSEDAAPVVADDAVAMAEPASAPAPAVEAAAAAEPVPATEPLPADETIAIDASDAVAASDRRCVRETGTRIPARDDDGCTSLPGDAYDRDDIDRTGAIDTADAIRKLSPSATIR